MAREMKDSGIEWIGEIPQNYNVYRLKYLLKRTLDYGANSSGVEYSDHLPRYIRITDIAADGKLKSDGALSLKLEDAIPYILDDGDILFARSGATVGKSFIYHTEYGKAAFAGYLIRAQLKEKVVSQYVYYYTCSSRYDIWKNGIFIQSTIQNISADKYANLPIVLPETKNEQIRIVSFFKYTCAEIDNVLEKTRASVEEYKKLKQAVITQAVTKGIRNSRKMSDSGSTWFGQIPNDWNMRKIKYIFRIQKDIAGEEGYTVLSITQKGIKPKDLSKNEGQLAENYSNYQLIHIGDFAMNHMDLLTGWVDVSKYEGVTSPDYRVFRLVDKDNYHSKYYLYLMQMCYTNRIFYGLGQGVSGLGRWRLQADKFLNFLITIPSYEEQKEIADYLDKKCSAIDDLIIKKQQYLTEIENYKKSLLYEYVTGKKEVPQKYQV